LLISLRTSTVVSNKPFVIESLLGLTSSTTQHPIYSKCIDFDSEPTDSSSLLKRNGRTCGSMSHRALHPEFAHIIDPLSSVTSWLIVAFMILTPLISFYFIRQEQFLIFISNHQTGNQSVIQLHIFIQYIFQHHNMSSTLANGMRPRTRLSLSRDISNTNAGNAEVPRRRKNALVSGFKSDRSWIKRETGTQFFDFWGRAVGDTIG
jgi:hypothetical protein